ncbi:MAG: hypothetical protein CSB55_06255 [Candidatus Cloacimonadota bacterium]|nr:MAG: hypothetical protein CSB55_06255 [Candidatus Cloacimonadota bacterium]
MNKITLILIIIAVFSIGMLTAIVKSDVTWLTDMDEAAKISKETQKPILIDFTGSDWCGWCIKLDQEVFEKEAFKKYAKDNLVLVKLDFPSKIKQSEETKKHNEKWLEKYGVRGFPTILLVDHEFKVINQTGYQRGGAEAYVKHLRELLK